MAIATGNRNRLLIVDDEPGNIRILSSILATDYELSAATNAEQALQLARSQLPELILLDMVMPDMDGLALCQALKADEATQHIPVAVCSWLDDEECELAAGATFYLKKPILYADFLAALEGVTHARV